MSEITISGEKFTVPTPFAEGMALNGAQAAALNQLMAENCRNNFSKKVKEAKESGAFDHDAMQISFTEYADKYEFGVRTGGGGRGPSVTPEMKEAIRLAETAITHALKAKGAKVGGKDGYSHSQIKEKAKVLAADESKPYLAQARERLAQAQALASDSMDDLLGDLGEPKPVEQPAALAAAKGKRKGKGESSPAEA